MRKRLKNSNEVAHFWANQSQEEGRCANMYFEGKSIYSYGPHFEAGRFVVDDRGKSVVLHNPRSYSVTTAKHMGQIRYATNQYPCFDAIDFNNHTTSLAYLIGLAKDSKEKVFTVNKHHLAWLSEYKTAAKNALDYNDRFTNSIYKSTLPKESRAFFRELKKYNKNCLYNSAMDFSTGKPAYPLTEEEIKTLEGKINRADFLERTKAEREPALEKARERRTELKLEKQAKQMVESITKWRNNEGNYSLRGYDGTLLRLNNDKDRVQTSRGAEISVKLALKLWDKLKARESIEGFDFGPYQADSYKNEVLTVGCHNIPVSEIKMIAEQLGV